MLGLVVAHGGWILLPIAATSVAAVAVALERCLRLLPMRGRIERMRLDLVGVIATAGAEAAQARAITDTPVGRIGEAILASRTNGEEAMRRDGLEAAQREVAACERGLGILLAASQVAPLFGLLGTVLGLIEAFQGASTAERISASVLSGGIYKALTTTVAGLLVAIPAYLAYMGLGGVVARIVQSLERTVGDLTRAVAGRR